MVSETSYKSKNVCVIGAGPSGLVAARELRKEGHKVVVLEQNHDIGGQWLYQPNVEGDDPLGRKPFQKVHSSIYESLRLTSPREIMGFTDFPFMVKKGRDMRRFPSHTELLDYLKDFCEWFGLREMIRFNTRVEYVGMLNYGVCSNNDLKWVVRSIDKKSEKVVQEVFDAVVVASGHYSHPRLPSLKGMDTWNRKQMHSHIYRSPEPFRNEIVVVVGTSDSGKDISLELVKIAKEVHMCSRSLISEGLSKVISKHENFHLHPQIDTLHEDGKVTFVDGSSISADTILYCTGYSYVFPFLDTQGKVVVDDDRVGPLYEHTFPPSLAPSLSFIGIPRKILGFPMFEAQAIWIAQVLSGRKVLPPWEDMMKSIKEFYHLRDVAGIPKHCTHDIGGHRTHENDDITGFEYCDKYLERVGLPPLEEWRKELCTSSVINAYINLETYRDSWDNDNDKIQEALQSPHFTQFIGLQDSSL